ncbi:LytR family transcriptional regulator [Corynebacterium liangguodongii]|uniref:LytR family transcriptional regulator n=1 Tax=Corynebacterium liangguodongii TaxID=2079535 RepID=A0A2S0WGV9_9CORY|nr:LytR family transcriptional regulator [Corynebacterium liangguodongii]PWC00678.1 LytR family transcriptional regulator [Corynebacterium liangguodongii]
MRDISQAGHPVLKGALAATSAAIIAISGIGYFSVGRLGGQLSASELQLREGGADSLDGAVDILLVGSDSRTDAQGNPLSEDELARLNAGVADGEINTDTIMVIRIPDDGSRATAVSIPRDTYIHHDEFGNMKINGVYASYAAKERERQLAGGASEGPELEKRVARAGQEGLIDAVADLTGVEVDHFAQVGLLGFALLTDAVGGVDVCLNAPVDEPLSGAKFPAGEQTLSGAQALSFVRQRHDLPRGDLDRIVRQQVYMASLVHKTLSAGTLANPSKLRELASAAERSVTLDEGWDVVKFAQQMSGLAAGDVTFTTIPVTSVDGVGDYGESIVTVDVSQVHDFMDAAVRPPEPAPEDGAAPAAPAGADALTGATIYALNAGETDGQAGGVAGWLKERGVDIAEVSNAVPGVYSQSQVVALDAEDPAAQALAQMLGGLPVTANEGLEPGSLVVVVAGDYAGPVSAAAATATSAQPSPEDAVGTPGEDFGTAVVAPEIDAGGDGPRCVN